MTDYDFDYYFSQEVYDEQVVDDLEEIIAELEAKFKQMDEDKKMEELV